MKKLVVGKYSCLEYSLIEMLQKRQEHNPMEPIAIVVNGSSLKNNLQKNILKSLEGFANIFFYTLEELALESFHFAQSHRKFLPSYLQHLLIFETIKDIHFTSYFREIIRSRNASKIISQTISFLKQQNIAPEVFQNIAEQENNRKWQEIALIYIEYQKQLVKYNFADYEDVLQSNSQDFISRFFSISMYGFFEHTPLEYNFLASLINHKEVLGYIPFRHSTVYTPVQKLISWYYQNGFQVHDWNQSAPQNANELSPYLFRKQLEIPFDLDIDIYSCTNEIEEVDAIVSFLDNIKEKNSIAILLPQNAVYKNCFENSCYEHFASYSFLSDTLLSIFAQSKFILFFLEIFTKNFNHASILNFLYHAEFDCQQIMQKFNIKDSFSINEVESLLFKQHQMEYDKKELKNNQKTLQFILDYLKSVEQKLQQQTDYDSLITIFIESIILVSKTKQIEPEIMQIFTQIASIPFLPTTLKNLEDILSLALQTKFYSHPENALLTGEISEIIGGNFSYLMISGAMKSFLPQTKLETTVFTKEEKANLSKILEKEIFTESNERLLFCLLLDSTDKVAFSYARTEYLTGKEYQLSVFLQEIWRVFPRNRGYKKIAQTTEIYTLLEYDLFLLTKALEKDEGALSTLFSSYPIWKQTINFLQKKWLHYFTEFDGMITSSTALELLKNFLPNKNISIAPSFLEHYAYCPFQFFVAKILNIKETKSTSIPKISMSQRKKVLLKILKKCNRAQKSNIHEIVQQTIAESLSPIFSKYKMIWDIEKIRLANTLENYVHKIFKSKDMGDYHYVEYNNSNHITLNLDPEKKLRFSGFIDQVDVKANKSYGVQYRWEKPRQTKNNCFYSGQQLQLAVELLALEKIFDNHYPSQVEYRYIQESGDYKDVYFDYEDKNKLLGTLEKICYFIFQGMENGTFFATPEPQKCRNCNFIEVCGPFRNIIYQVKQDDPRVEFYRTLENM